MQKVLSKKEINAYKKVVRKGEDSLKRKELEHFRNAQKILLKFLGKRFITVFSILFAISFTFFHSLLLFPFAFLTPLFVAFVFTFFSWHKFEAIHGLPSNSHRFSRSSSSYTSPNGASHNPATGLSMMSSSIDVGGNAFGSSSSSISSSSSYRGF